MSFGLHYLVWKNSYKIWLLNFTILFFNKIGIPSIYIYGHFIPDISSDD